LVIAVHSALYIFRPGLTAVGEGGLFRYRHSVYVAWVAFSILMPSLAYINSAPAYSAQGTFCYLPVRPVWYRMALAWVPRYIILVTILILYASIYIYVRMKFRTFRSHVGASTLEMDTIDLAIPEPPKDEGGLPQLDDHGLISTLPTSDSRQASNASDQPFAKLSQTIAEKLNFPPPCSSEPRPWTCDGASSPSRRGSLPVSITNPEGGTGSSSEISHGNKARGGAADGASAELRRRRIAISRQLRLLFIYPLVYALMWIPSLVSNLLQYRDQFVRDPNYPLACMVAFTIPIQCAVDCWLFTIREKPWRYIPESNGKSFWSRYGFIRGEGCHGAGGKDGEGWKNRKSMTFEARKAYERREEERKEAAELWLQRLQRQDEKGRLSSGSAPSVPAEPKKAFRSWWDGFSDDLDEIVEEAKNRRDSQGHLSHADELSSLEAGMGGGSGQDNHLILATTIR